MKCRLKTDTVLCFRPVLVTFEEFKDREEVLRKAALLRGSHVHVTEDMSRYGQQDGSVKIFLVQESQRKQSSPKEVLEGPEDQIT